jgi:hypothetical protein
VPKELEEKLKREAEANPDVHDKDAYVYGTLNKIEKKRKHKFGKRRN